ncbi:DUF3626 domain-containing protein [Dactylosporangium sp. CS-033363]|uniref:DUF3626 domain-containing protein n=1 Tax=Dactylosporangium sp. CS-033363 TaxID=3239935 RepID=UPI003D8CA776
MLTEAQSAALDHVRRRGSARTPLGSAAVITINFHPDRSVGGRTVLQGLAADGRFRSQFETGISNGGLTAYPGGDRDRWEERMFGGAYQRPGVRAGDRPKYGALNLLHHDDGAAPRFGSAHLRLRPHVNAWATFTFGDSAREPTEAGTADAFDAVLAALHAHHGADALHRPRLAGPGRALDDYVEAQIHGPVRLADDAEALVLDSSFKGSGCGTAEASALLAQRYGLTVEWRTGFRLAPADIPDVFRGPEVPVLARELCARLGVDAVDPALIGVAARAPQEWAGHGTPAEVLQLLKYLWHCLVQYG